MDLNTMVLSAITFVLGIGVVWTKASKVLKAMGELSHVLTAIVSAFSDQALSAEEVANIKKEIAEALEAFRAILK